MYNRTAKEKAHDFANSRKFELEVGEYLPKEKTQSLSEDKPDWIVFHDTVKVIVEVKEKNQKYRTDTWPLHEGVDEQDQFIIDERTIRKLNMESPFLWFFVRDNITARTFLLPVWELMCGRRNTADRKQSNVDKGKWIISLIDFRQVSLEELWPTILEDMKTKPWRNSQCVLPTHKIASRKR